MSELPVGATRRQIIDAAVRLIADHGFSATSVDQIAEAAGVAKGSVYYNFGSKADLFTSILTEGITRLTANLRTALETGPEPTPLERLVTALLRQIRDNPAFAKVVAAEVFRTGRDWQESIGLIHDQAMAVFAEAVGLGDPDLDPLDARVMGSAAFGATLVAGLEWLTYQPDRSPTDVLAAILRMVRRA
ncbi:TetR/AcrR family transcriptional regulator [Isoptericola sp. b441]|uniref:TetR/AcrR family transcriptional regulator n=1 Tax=Actinotalea lenta TaxID=3064654 RepID=A0ABT9D6A8_9CELL|nr:MULTISPECIES: TetR/AcrR family transcriptional regulator [unclassified Isoptericola]MDO8105684.1 TetR/AcrR family transcriptional regulator [Isoptericola sp. b441]MDO8122389.1 TetR/AcrR family transcriptional regulator [Isoptericola sp. b490]